MRRAALGSSGLSPLLFLFSSSEPAPSRQQPGRTVHVSRSGLQSGSVDGCQSLLTAPSLWIKERARWYHTALCLVASAPSATACETD
ncbi:hypothetical protein BaRGS_00001124 [Batillaria attramentaria]|uniref:Secreted protein n=1 Tax=Batillaria attramentaria TaxID=370345 RepID=A0ABD0M736_9CAEN